MDVGKRRTPSSPVRGRQHVVSASTTGRDGTAAGGRWRWAFGTVEQLPSANVRAAFSARGEVRLGAGHVRDPGRCEAVGGPAARGQGPRQNGEPRSDAWRCRRKVSTLGSRSPMHPSARPVAKEQNVAAAAAQIGDTMNSVRPRIVRGSMAARGSATGRAVFGGPLRSSWCASWARRSSREGVDCRLPGRGVRVFGRSDAAVD